MQCVDENRSIALYCPTVLNTVICYHQSSKLWHCIVMYIVIPKSPIHLPSTTTTEWIGAKHRHHCPIQDLLASIGQVIHQLALGVVNWMTGSISHLIIIKEISCRELCISRSRGRGQSWRQKRRSTWEQEVHKIAPQKCIDKHPIIITILECCAAMPSSQWEMDRRNAKLPDRSLQSSTAKSSLAERKSSSEGVGLEKFAGANNKTVIK